MAKMTNSSICYACKQKRTRSSLGYCIYTLKTYCMDRRICSSPYHPEYDLIPTDSEQFLEAIDEAYPPDVAEAFRSKLGKTHSTRLTPTQLMFLFKYGQKFGTGSFSDTIAHMVELAMESHKDLDSPDESLVLYPWVENDRKPRFGQVSKKIKELREEKVVEPEPEEDEDTEGLIML